jgi:hypothetical protein
MAMTAAGTTVEALMYGLRSGVRELSAPDTLGRLRELDDAQLRVVVDRLRNFMPHIAKPWTADEIAALIAAWGKVKALPRTGAR